LERQTKEQYKLSERWYKNVFSTIFPNYHLTDLDQFERYKVVVAEEKTSCFVFQHTTNPLLFKLETLLSLSPETTLLALTNPRLYKNWHP
jgi:hypothetical protein